MRSLYLLYFQQLGRDFPRAVHLPMELEVIDAHSILFVYPRTLVNY